MSRTDNLNLDFYGNPRVQTVFNDESLTVQSDAEKADINRILKRHSMGIIDHMADVDARYMDVSEFSDYADAYRESKRAEMEFMKLHPKVRRVFNNDVAEWLDAAHEADITKTKWAPGLQELGLLEVPPAPQMVNEEIPGEPE